MPEAAQEKPNIAYVDEVEDARADFFTDAYHSGLFDKIYALPPEPTLGEMVDKLLDLKIDALVSDFQLTEAGPVDYTGEGLVDAILSKRAGFPCFIQTSVEQAALVATDDVNRVYSKNPNAQSGGREGFLNRIALQIGHHQTRMIEWQEELAGLLAIDRKQLTAAQIERILELDDAIEGNLGSDDTVTQQAKRDLLTENLSGRQVELIDETQKLIEEMRRALDE